MDRIVQIVNCTRVYNIKILFSTSILSALLLFIMLVPSYGAPITKVHDNISGDITDPECSDCHVTQKTIISEQEISQNDGKIPKSKQRTAGSSLIQSPGSGSVQSLAGSISGSNYTALLAVGQTPYQLGPFFRGYAGWSWWDAGNWGTEKQKNLIALMVLDNTSGTIKPLTGLTSPPVWPQSNYRNYSGVYSYKADTDPTPITTLNNYPDNVDLWMIKVINLTGASSANLTFRTWYKMETDWDYGYVMVSDDGGNNWVNLQGTLTTSTDPNGNNLGNGITGSSNAWVQETIDLTSYAGNKILLGFRFKSDAATNEEGWYVDDINITSGTTTIFSDDAEIPQVIRTLSVNVTYPHLTLINVTDPLSSATTLQYTQRMQQVNLQEDIAHPGTYLGYFRYDPFVEQYSGNYTVALDTLINSTQVTATAQFQTTIFGCQSCHNKKYTGAETSFTHGEGGGMQSCTYICHSGSRGFYGGSPPYMGPPLPANPMHIHEMQYGHNGGFLDGAWYPQPPYNITSHVTSASCTQCHTSFIHDNTGTDTANIASYTLYGSNISFSSGMHDNLTCENCHGTLDYPAIPQNQYQLQGSLGSYSPAFTSSESFTHTYIAAVNSTENLSITITSENTAKSISLYIIGPVDNTTTALQAPCGGNPCEITQSLETPIDLNITNPYIGTWLIKLTQLQEGTVNYTITSNYPIQRKPVIQIPECRSCHNPTAAGKTYTKYEIPGWNPGFAHADANRDGTLDIQCRMCHSAMHNITIKDCRNCHTTAPGDHPIGGPLFSQYTQDQCLTCHGDPHRVSTAGETCIECHGTNYTGANPVATTTLVNISAFNESIHQDINATPPATLNNIDCWSCHYNRDMDRQNVKKCSGCHRRPSQWHGNADITTNLSELW